MTDDEGLTIAERRAIDWQVCMDWLDVQGAPQDTTLIGRLILWQAQGYRRQEER